MALALLILNIKNPVGLGLKVDGTAAEALQSLEDNHNKVTEMGLVNALRDLHTAYLVPGTPLAEHVSRLRNLWQVANDMGAKIDDAGFRTIFISLLGEDWDNVVPVLYTFKTSSEVISFVTMHAERLNRVPPSSSTTSTTALAANTFTNRDARRAARKNLVCSNPQCGAPGRKGHTIADCFWPGGGKEGQWPAWWKGKRPTAVANNVETFAFTAWTVPEAVVDIYDEAGIQTVDFRGEKVLASPESLMAWNEAVEATLPLTLREGSDNEPSPDFPQLGDASYSFDFVDGTSFSSEFELLASTMPDSEHVENSDDQDTGVVATPFPESRAAVQIAAEAFLQAGQPYPGDDHIQDERRFLVYQTSDTEHIVMDNMTDNDVLISTHHIRDTDFDIIEWYAAHCRLVLGLPADHSDASDDDSIDSDTDLDSDGEDDPDQSYPEVSALVADSQPTKYVVVVDSGAIEHCFCDRNDFTEYKPVESREGNAAEGSKFRILATGVVRKIITYQGHRKEISFDAIHTPDSTNLISISKLDARGYIVEFGGGKAIFKRANGSVFMEAMLSGGMYRVEFEDGGITANVAAASDSSR
ncbi:hypothetical protein GGX14DRAFT_652149 [Mycena pura]|uniref:Retrovirus-related Pol polyprotein from transposon TNT 1-94-like beta-barrel domain-containing protein n=1 Tax=Mycena pura TaxID=153505 RepID=A0AAD6V6A1_9AGAR|nr:hypothetical protein GGX14DRAFT_652149 [Mycena pura]